VARRLLWNTLAQVRDSGKTLILTSHRFAGTTVVHLYSSFSMDPLDFFLVANLYQKLLFLAILAAVRPHF